MSVMLSLSSCAKLTQYLVPLVLQLCVCLSLSSIIGLDVNPEHCRSPLHSQDYEVCKHNRQIHHFVSRACRPEVPTSVITAGPKN